MAKLTYDFFGTQINLLRVSEIKIIAPAVSHYTGTVEAHLQLVLRGVGVEWHTASLPLPVKMQTELGRIDARNNRRFFRPRDFSVTTERSRFDAMYAQEIRQMGEMVTAVLKPVAEDLTRSLPSGTAGGLRDTPGWTLLRPCQTSFVNDRILVEVGTDRGERPVLADLELPVWFHRSWEEHEAAHPKEIGMRAFMNAYPAENRMVNEMALFQGNLLRQAMIAEQEALLEKFLQDYMERRARRHIIRG